MSITDSSDQTIVGSIKIDYPVTQQFVDDLLITAFEGGITYWCIDAYPRNYSFPFNTIYTSECLTRGRDIILVEDDDGENHIHVLTLDNLLAGIKQFVDLHNSTDVFEDHDAGDADLIIQFAIFGKSVYA